MSNAATMGMTLVVGRFSGLVRVGLMRALVDSDCIDVCAVDVSVPVILETMVEKRADVALLTPEEAAETVARGARWILPRLVVLGRLTSPACHPLQAGRVGGLVALDAEPADLTEAIQFVHRQFRIDASHHDPGPGLTAAEHRVFPLLVDGATNKQIAATLGVSTETVKSHVAHILRKLGVASRYTLIAHCPSRGRDQPPGCIAPLGARRSAGVEAVSQTAGSR